MPTQDAQPLPTSDQAARMSAKDSKALDRSIFQGMAWTGAMKWSGQIFTWLSTVIVARLLTPEDYGLIAMATVFLGVIGMVNEFGVGTALLTFRNLSDREVAQLNSLSLILGFGGFTVACLGAIPMSKLFRTSDLPQVIIVLAAGFMVLGLKGVPYALLQRDMRFKFLAVTESLQMLIQAVSAVCFALLGFSYWTLVLGNLVGTLVSTAMIVRERPHSFATPRLSALSNVLTFSRHVVVARIGWYLYSNADTVVVGRVLGQGALGVYSFGLSLANMVVEKISGMSNQVTSSLFGSIQQDHAAIRRYLLMFTEGFALLSFPLTIGLALVADDFVILVLGEKWFPMVIPLQILSATAAFRSVSALPSQVLFAIKDARFGMWNGVICTIIFPIAFYLGSYWGTVGVAMVWAIVYPPLSYRINLRVFPVIGLSHRQYWKSFQSAAVATLAMSVMVIAVKLAMPADWAVAIRLGIEVMAGGVVYAVAVWILCRGHIREFIRIVYK